MDLVEVSGTPRPRSPSQATPPLKLQSRPRKPLGPVPPELDGARLDRALARLLPRESRTRVQEWIKDGGVRVDGGAEFARLRACGGVHEPADG